MNQDPLSFVAAGDSQKRNRLCREHNEDLSRRNSPMKGLYSETFGRKKTKDERRENHFEQANSFMCSGACSLENL